MRNKDFNELDKAKKYVDIYFKVAISFCIVMAVLMLIAGIVLCVYDGVSGVIYIISGAIFCGIGIFGVFVTRTMLAVFVDGLNDIKQSGLAIDAIATSDKFSNNETDKPKSYESCTNYYLYYIDKNAYLCSSSMSGQGMSVVKNVLSALKFQSEDEAKRFADYKRIEIGDKWQIVKKDLIIPID